MASSDSKTTDLHEFWLRSILDSDYEPSDWEYEFLESIEARLKAGRALTEGQEAKLDQIYQKATGA